MYNIRDKVIKAFEDELFPFKGGFQEKESDVLNKKLANWVRIDENFFNQIKDQVKKVKNKNLYVRPNRGSHINLNDSFQRTNSRHRVRKITHEEVLKKVNQIRSDIEINNDQDFSVKHSRFTGEFKQYKKVGHE